MNLPDVDNPDFWDEMYKEGRTAWDIGSTTPAIEQYFASRSTSDPMSVLELGCGKGHDAIAIAQLGYAVTAVDFSNHAIRIAGKHAAHENTAISFCQKNIFDLSPEFDSRFDIVVEYVTYCAINPSRRSEFASVVSRLLKSDGKLVALFFPIDDRPSGPPFAVDYDEVVRLFEKHLTLEKSYEPSKSIEPRRGKEKMTVWTKVGSP